MSACAIAQPCTRRNDWRLRCCLFVIRLTLMVMVGVRSKMIRGPNDRRVPSAIAGACVSPLDGSEMRGAAIVVATCSVNRHTRLNLRPHSVDATRDWWIVEDYSSTRRRGGATAGDMEGPCPRLWS